jgi:hypothetical protein
MTAREQLAAAHRRMTAEEIAANALDLANAVELLSGALNDAYDALRKADRCARGFSDNCRDLHATVQRAQSLFASHRRAEARELIAGMASIRFEGMPARGPGVLASLVAPPVDHMLNPKVSSK